MSSLIILKFTSSAVAFSVENLQIRSLRCASFRLFTRNSTGEIIPQNLKASAC